MCFVPCVIKLWCQVTLLVLTLLLAMLLVSVGVRSLPLWIYFMPTTCAQLARARCRIIPIFASLFFSLSMCETFPLCQSNFSVSFVFILLHAFIFVWCV